MLDGLLKLNLWSGVEIITFAYDAVLKIAAKHLEDTRISRILMNAYNTVQRWIDLIGLKLAIHKTEAVLFTSNK